MWWILKWKYNLKITFWVLFLTDVLVKLDVHENDYIDFYKRHKIHVRLVSEVVISFFIFSDAQTQFHSFRSSLFQGSFPGNLHLVLVLRPSTFLQRTLSDVFFKVNKDEFKMKVCILRFFLAFFLPWIFKNCISAVATVTSPQNKLFHQHLL